MDSFAHGKASTQRLRNSSARDFRIAILGGMSVGLRDAFRDSAGSAGVRPFSNCFGAPGGRRPVPLRAGVGRSVSGGGGARRVCVSRVLAIFFRATLGLLAVRTLYFAGIRRRASGESK